MPPKISDSIPATPATYYLKTDTADRYRLVDDANSITHIAKSAVPEPKS